MLDPSLGERGVKPAMIPAKHQLEPEPELTIGHIAVMSDEDIDLFILIAMKLASMPGDNRYLGAASSIALLMGAWMMLEWLKPAEVEAAAVAVVE